MPYQDIGCSEIASEPIPRPCQAVNVLQLSFAPTQTGAEGCMQCSAILYYTVSQLQPQTLTILPQY